MKQVADASGVSQATVSHVLNGNAVTHRIATGTQARVRDAAARLGYRRNQSARSMRLGRFMAIGFVVSSELNYFGFARQPRLVRGLAAGCDRHNCYLRLVVLEPKAQDPDAYLRATFQELGVDGLVIGEHTELAEPLVSAIHKYRVPTLWANELREYDCVIPDEADGVSHVFNTFLEHGHTKLAYLDGGLSGHFSAQQRRDAWTALAEGHGLTCPMVKTPGEVHDATLKMVELLRSPDRPTACLVQGGERAQTLLWAAREARVRVPDDLSIVALDDHHFHNVGLNITFKRIPFREMGELASDLLEDKIANPGKRLPLTLVPYGELKEGESLALAPKA